MTVNGNMTTNVIPMDKRITMLFGPICSGKTTWSNIRLQACHEKYIDVSYIKVSDIVKNLSKAQTRSELQDTGDLEQQIASALIEEITIQFTDVEEVIVDGVRQLGILKSIIDEFALQSYIDLVWLEESKEELKRRFDERSQPRDLDLTFEEAYERDMELGLDKLKTFLTNINIIK